MNDVALESSPREWSFWKNVCILTVIDCHRTATDVVRQLLVFPKLDQCSNYPIRVKFQLGVVLNHERMEVDERNLNVTFDCRTLYRLCECSVAELMGHHWQLVVESYMKNSVSIDYLQSLVQILAEQDFAVASLEFLRKVVFEEVGRLLVRLLLTGVFEIVDPSYLSVMMVVVQVVPQIPMPILVEVH